MNMADSLQTSLWAYRRAWLRDGEQPKNLMVVKFPDNRWTIYEPDLQNNRIIKIHSPKRDP